MKQFPYSSLHKELVQPNEWPLVPANPTAQDMLRNLVNAHQQLPKLLYHQGRLTGEQRAMLLGLSEKTFEPYIAGDGSVRADISEAEKEQIQLNFRLFRDFWNQVLHPTYEGISNGINYRGGAPEVVLFRPCDSWLLRGEMLTFQLPTAVTWELDVAVAQTGAEQVILEIHTAINFPMMIRSCSRTMILPPQPSELADQKGYNVVMAATDYRVLQTCSRQIAGRELFFLVVRPCQVHNTVDLS